MKRKPDLLDGFSKDGWRLRCDLTQHMLSYQTIGCRAGMVVGGTQYEPGPIGPKTGEDVLYQVEWNAHADESIPQLFISGIVPDRP